MESDRRVSVAVGSFVIVCLAVTAFSIFSLTSESGVFTSQYTLIARFENVQGLLPGAPVWLAGKQVGRVVSVELTPHERELPVHVVLRIDRTVQDRIRMDSAASIGTIGVLGDAYVALSVGSEGENPIQDGNEIGTESPATLADALAKGTTALDSIASLAENLNVVVAGFAESGGGEKVGAVVASADEIMRQVQTGNGLLHSVVYDEYSGGGVASIQRSLASLENIMVELQTGEGILHTLIYDTPDEQDLVMQFLEAGAKLNSILQKVDRGEGSLGLIVNDPTLYEDVKRLVGGAGRSAVVRTLIRMSVVDDD